jgi:hypothetical protein
MFRLAIFSALLALVLQSQTFSQGPPASVTSPSADGRLHGVPASVVSPKARPFGVHPPQKQRPVFIARGPLRRFGNPRARRRILTPVPVFYPVYSQGYDSGDPPVADPTVAQTSDAADSGRSADSDVAVASSEDALRQAYLQGARDAMAQQLADSRYGQHYLDSREAARSYPPVAKPAVAAEKPSPSKGSQGGSPMAKAPEVDNSPAAVFIFKDGRQIEIRNYAIMGQTLYDLSSNPLKKVQLADLDAAATLKANDDRGIQVKLP